jgi:hypothetical protein
MAIAAFAFGLAYAAGSAVRGHVLSGLVTAVIVAVLVFLVLSRVQDHNAAVRRRRERAP